VGTGGGAVDCGSIPDGVIGIFHSHNPSYGHGFESASKINEYRGCILLGKAGRCVGLTTLPPLRSDCDEIWEPQPPGTLRACRLLYLQKYRKSKNDVYTILGRILTFWTRNYFFSFSTPVYKIRIIQQPNMIEL